MEIRVLLTTGMVELTDVDRDETLLGLKNTIEDMSGIEPSGQTLYFQNLELPMEWDGRRIQDVVTELCWTIGAELTPEGEEVGMALPDMPYIFKVEFKQAAGEDDDGINAQSDNKVVLIVRTINGISSEAIEDTKIINMDNHQTTFGLFIPIPGRASAYSASVYAPEVGTSQVRVVRDESRWKAFKGTGGSFLKDPMEAFRTKIVSLIGPV